VTDLRIPGNPARFDYQSIDPTGRRLYLARLGDSTLVVVDLDPLRVATTVPDIASVHGVALAPDLRRVYASATGVDQLVGVDTTTNRIVSRADTGNLPDGVAYDEVRDVEDHGVASERAWRRERCDEHCGDGGEHDEPYTALFGIERVGKPRIAAHAHHKTLSSRPARSMPPHVGSLLSSAATWVNAKTKTRSKNSSSGTTVSRSGGSTGAASGTGQSVGFRYSASVTWSPQVAGPWVIEMWVMKCW